MPRLARLLVVLLACALAKAQSAPEPGVAHALAQARAARLSGLHYALTYTLVPKAPTTIASETLTFTDSGAPAGSAPEVPIDFRDGALLTATLNGTALPTTLVNGHLMLPAAVLHQGANTLVTTFTANIAASGKAITRYLDKDDGAEYLYTLFVPMDADMAFPCFDQPDLKATFKLRITIPANWTVITNSSGDRALRQELSAHGPDPRTLTFPETQPISTYLFAFAAGPFARIPGKSAGEPSIYVRQSQLAKAQTEAPEVQSITARGIAWLSDYFAQPFPFPKYDLVLIPGFPFGGMEHAGATFLNEDGVLFRSTPTSSDYFKRDILVLHETTHQWFGDLVTMRWFDDLWLKEGFAQYMAYKAMAELKPAGLNQPNPWKHFNEDIKPLAYAIDETRGTTPIFQQIPNLKDAKSAYGAIVYQKAPAILKQLNYRIGNDVFRQGLRFYLAQHAYANATWLDLIGAFEQAGASARGSKLDLKPWADAWITHRGMPQIDTSFACDDGKLTALTLTQHDILPDNYAWPLSTEVLLSAPGAEDHIRVDWSTPTIQVQSAIGKPCPNFVFANAGDQAYGRFLLDSGSQRFLAPAHLNALPPIAEILDPLLRSQLYTAQWENVRTAHASPASYVELALWSLDDEQDESLNRIQGGRITTAFHSYITKPTGLRGLAYSEIRRKMFEAPTLDLRIVNFHTFVALADEARAQGTLADLLDGKATIPGLQLKLVDRWGMVGKLISSGSLDAPARLQAEQARDHSGEAQKYAYAAQAATPTPAAKARYFADYQSTGIQEDWLTQSLRPFNSYNQQPLTLPYLKQSLDLLPEIKRTRKIFFLGAWLSAVLDGQTTPEAQTIVNQWLNQPGQSTLDPDLRLKVLENKDSLDRTVLIRRTYPN